MLAASTANDGSETVTLPEVGTDRARLKVEAVGNYFFDVNDADFTIASPLSLTEVADQSLQYSDDFAAPVTVTATSDAVDGDQLTATVAGVEGLSVAPGATSADGVRPGTRVFTITGPVTQAPGVHEAVVTVAEPGAGGLTSEGSFTVTVEPEDASVDWTGPTQVSTDDATATVPLETSVTDAADADRGDIADGHRHLRRPGDRRGPLLGPGHRWPRDRHRRLRRRAGAQRQRHDVHHRDGGRRFLRPRQRRGRHRRDGQLPPTPTTTRRARRSPVGRRATASCWSARSR